jgi:adenosyl cobinamide kinase/adenosyl cobinamide phosphate guanylyltransferase
VPLVRPYDAAPVIVLVLGGTRSGKSETAEALVTRLVPPVTYVATGWATPEDPGMLERIEAHRAARPASWVTVEAGGDLIGALRCYPEGTMLVDALGTWVAAHPDLAVDVDALLAALQARIGPTVVVSEEVGLAVHPTTERGRRFVDVMGTLNQAVAGVADEVHLVVAGRTLRLDGRPDR